MNEGDAARSPRVLQGPGVWMEGNALEQLARVARLPGCVAAVGLPDLHAGPGIPVGAAFAFKDQIRPALVGSDAGCGVRLDVLPRVKFTGDALERRVREETEGPVIEEGLVPLDAIAKAAWSEGPRGLLRFSDLPEGLLVRAATEPPVEPLTVDDADLCGASWAEVGASLGTVGGGNHFIEVTEVTGVFDRTAAQTIGLSTRSWAVLVHSGSRGLGASLHEVFGAREYAPSEARAYRRALEGALRVARTNRFLLAWRLLRATGGSREGAVSGSLDLVHNDVSEVRIGGESLWLHRKGAAPAAAGQLTVTLGSRGTPSWLLAGFGSEESLCCVAHGAGRRMGRSEAREKLSHRFRRNELTRSGGGRVICDDTALLYEEHPEAYKDVEPVVEALVEAGAASKVARLEPRVTVKR